VRRGGGNGKEAGPKGESGRRTIPYSYSPLVGPGGDPLNGQTHLREKGKWKEGGGPRFLDKKYAPPPPRKTASGPDQLLLEGLERGEGGSTLSKKERRFKNQSRKTSCPVTIVFLFFVKTKEAFPREGGSGQTGVRQKDEGGKERVRNGNTSPSGLSFVFLFNVEKDSGTVKRVELFTVSRKDGTIDRKRLGRG